MKAPFFSLTILFALLPTLVPNFNTSSTKVRENTTAPKAVRYFGSYFQDRNTSPLPFGEKLGKYIKETRIGEADYKIRKIVIDPGHGGRDGGCSGTNTREKVIALKIALQLGRTLKSYYPNLEVIFTRTEDVFVPLNKRAELANKKNADLFISIHCNNIANASQVKGSETYVLGLHRAEDNLNVAKRENASIFFEDNYQETYDNYDPNSAEGHIILSMYQNAHLEHSILLADKIEGKIKNSAHGRSRGVRQAGFLVLRKTTMPSVLVEAGYLSNRKDNAYLATRQGQTEIASAIFNAFVDYKYEVEGNLAGTTRKVQAAARVNPRIPAPATNTTQRSNIIPQEIKTPPTRTTTKGLRPSLIIPSKKTSPAPAPKTPQNAASIEAKPQTTAYKVILMLTDQLANTDQAPWNKIEYTIQVQREGAAFRYLTTSFATFEAAVAAKNELRKIGFSEAFVAKYKGGKRMVK